MADVIDLCDSSDDGNEIDLCASSEEDDVPPIAASHTSAIAARAARPASSTASDGAASAAAASALESRLRQFYSRHNPSKLNVQGAHSVSKVAEFFEGKEAELNAALTKQYGVGLDSLPPNSASTASASATAPASASASASSSSSSYISPHPRRPPGSVSCPPAFPG